MGEKELFGTMQQHLECLTNENKKLKERIQLLENIIKHLRNKFIAISADSDPIAVSHITKLIDDVLNDKE